MKKIIFLLSVFVSTSTLASFSCEVDVKRVLVYKSGVINVLHSGRNDYTHICNLKGSWNGVDTVTCAMWASMLQNLQLNNQKAIFYYDGEGSCQSLATYSSSPAPVYIGTVH